MAKMGRFLSIPVMAVFLLMCFVYYSTIFVFIEELMCLKSSAGLLNALAFSFSALMCFVSFVSSVVTDPGFVPATYAPEVEDGEFEDPELKKSSVKSRYCDKCGAHKPPRAHHCRVCKRCVMRMDHHCTWINNCVGFSNYKKFIIFIFYSAISCSYSLVIFFTVTLRKDWGVRWSPLKTFYVSCGSIMTALGATLVTLLVWHLYLLVHNTTTIEYHEGRRARWLARKSGLSYRHPFDLGLCKNIILLLGQNVLTWPCPTAVHHAKDGTDFPTSHDN
ncbi:hypothetical protein Sjap_001423 [Stephania japonica]|uniref:S-acyltransferase n=1 Tax=Stephania japonica TaxID=461633 RepID=A0AAP0KJW9_9MAGN